MNIKDIIKQNKSTVEFPYGYIKTLTWQELININEIQIPDIQVNLNEDKVIEIMESYTNNPKFFIPKCLFTIAELQTTDITKYYLVDGQHRFEAITRLMNKDDTINNNILLAIIPTNSIGELLKLFKELNIDSLKYPKLSNFEWVRFERLKDKLKNKYPELPNTIKNKNNTYTIGQFLEILQNKNILNVLNKKNNLEQNINEEDYDLIDNDEQYINEILKKLEKKNKEFFKKANYLEIVNKQNDDYNFQQIEKDMIVKHNCMFFKRNNFIDWLIDNTIIPEHDIYDRKTINTKLKNQIWLEEFEAKNSGNCPIWECKKVLDKSVSNSWQCGHLISVKNGGSNKLENFRPICPACNLQMSDTNWDEYVDKIKNNTILETYFDEDEEIKCKKKGCKIKINKTNFHYFETKKKDLKPCCKECTLVKQII